MTTRRESERQPTTTRRVSEGQPITTRRVSEGRPIVFLVHSKRSHTHAASINEPPFESRLPRTQALNRQTSNLATDVLRAVTPQ
jgi:hypothetical protein